MNSKLLIDAIVRQTTVLIAQLSTAAGIRAPLAHIADQVFVELSREIESQGVSRKVAADMFGMALRTYQSRVQRLTASATEQQTTLWESVLTFIEQSGSVSRRRVLERFERDDPLSVGAVLADLTSGGFVYRSGSGESALYRVTSDVDRRELMLAQDDEALALLVWVGVYRGASSPEAIVDLLGLELEQVTAALERLVQRGHLSRDDSGALRGGGPLVPVGAEHGWEAAVFDHFQAMVTAITRKLQNGGHRSADGDVVGGSTLSFEVHSAHPLRAEVRGLLQRTRTEVNDLWGRVGAHNAAEPCPDEKREIVSFYFGQSVLPPEVE
ncbi:MAG TPA: hypothetical protein VM686_41275 [Polyangiaceae bacterium]|nr:hypothetical protein [Polyangiaceae bacterium]